LGGLGAVKTYRTALAATVLLLLVSACASDSGPSKADLRRSLATELPAYVEVASFTIEASQSAGTKVEPVYQTRFRAVLKLTADTFTEAERARDVLFVKSLKRRGDEIEVFGKTQSLLYGGNWQTAVSLDGSPLARLGKPLSMFSAARVIVKGSREETEYRAEVERLEREKMEAARRAAEEKRREMEYMRTNLPGRWRTGFETLQFGKDGSVKLVSHDGKRTVSGVWRLEGDRLIIKYSDGAFADCRVQKFSVNELVGLCQDGQTSVLRRLIE